MRRRWRQLRGCHEVYVPDDAQTEKPAEEPQPPVEQPQPPAEPAAVSAAGAASASASGSGEAPSLVNSAFWARKVRRIELKDVENYAKYAQEHPEDWDAKARYIEAQAEYENQPPILTGYPLEEPPEPWPSQPRLLTVPTPPWVFK